MTKYEQLKPYHIQQDSKNSCTIACALMILNAMRGEQLTIAEFRDLLYDDRRYLRRWHQDPNVGMGTFIEYLERLFELLMLESKVTGSIKRRSSYREFQRELELCTKVPKYFMLIERGIHWAPAASYEIENDSLMLLNVDTDIKTDAEYTHPQGEGESYFNSQDLWRNMGRREGFITVKRY